MTALERLEAQARRPVRAGAVARLRLREARRSDSHGIPGVEREPRTPLRREGRRLGDGLHRALRMFG